MKNISIVIPLYNEEESLLELYNKIMSVLSRMKVSQYEIIFASNGSTDGSNRIIKNIISENQNVQGIFINKNYGKAKGLSEGFKIAKFDYVITLDSDLQDDPEEIPGLIEEIDKGYDVISGWKKRRYDPFLSKNVPSKIFNWVTAKVSGLHIHDFNCGIKAYRLEVVKHITFYGEMHRYLPVIAHWEGFRVGEKVVQHHPRKFGATKYGMSRFKNGFLDLITIYFLWKCSRKPMHFFGSVSLFFMALSAGLLFYLMRIFFVYNKFNGNAMTLFGIYIFISLQFLLFGMLAELITYRLLKKSNDE